MTPPDFSELISILETTGIVSHPQWTKLKKSIRDIEQAYDEQLRRNSELSKGNVELIEDYGVLKDGFESLEKLNAELKRTRDLVVEERNRYRKQAELIKLIHWDSVPKSSRSEPDGYASPQTAKLASYVNATFHLVRALNELVTINNEG